MNVDSEQLTICKAVVEDQDQPLSTSEQFEILKKTLGSIEKRGFSGKTIFVFKYGVTCIALLTKAITYLGNPHPKFKKRIQLPDWYQSFCKRNPDLDVRFLGIYNYEGNIVFVDFKKDTYLQHGLHNSSAHVYINDLYQGMTYGIFEKTDKNGNRIVVVRQDKLSEYLRQNIKKDNVLFGLFESFNHKYPFDKWISSTCAIQDMYHGKWKHWRQAEWPGWYLEFKFATFCEEDGRAAGLMAYVGSSHKKKDGEPDFDIFFIADNFYGDLKASDIKKAEAPGNDKQTLVDCLYKHNRFWYVVYEHETIKDSIDNKYSATIERNRFIKRVDPSYKKAPTSYCKRMKRKVMFKRMCIIELNLVNYRDVLKDFHQGHQPDGTPREPKFLINKKMLNNDNFVIFRYEAGRE